MDFVSLTLFMSMYYLRPQEWFGFFNKLHPIQLVTIVAVYGLLTRKGGIKLGNILRTPEDWMMAAYFGWTVFASPNHWETFKSIQSVILFYFIGVQTLTTLPRLRSFLGWWAVMIMIIATLALVSEIGIDPLGTYEKTHGWSKGRLLLNLTIFNNPNTLAHSVLPVIPMLFFLLFWRRLFMKASIVVLLLPLWCVFLTESKGGFICGFVVLALTLTFGRPKAVQAVILASAVAFGSAAMYALPRMSEVKKTRDDPAVQGRIAAYTFGYEMMREHFYGIGLSNFQNEFFVNGPMEVTRHTRYLEGKNGERIPQVYYKRNHYVKATHGAYNQNGAELGYVGLFLFVGILYCCVRTLGTAKTANTEQERVRRILFVMVASYAASSWMVDFCYRPTFFLTVAAVSAFHRHLRGLYAEQPEDENEGAPAYMPAWLRPIQPAPAMAFAAPAMHMSATPPVAVASSQNIGISIEEEPEPVAVLNWKRLGILDFVLITILTWLTTRFWIYVIHHF